MLSTHICPATTRRKLANSAQIDASHIPRFARHPTVFTTRMPRYALIRKLLRNSMCTYLREHMLSVVASDNNDEFGFNTMSGRYFEICSLCTVFFFLHISNMCFKLDQYWGLYETVDNAGHVSDHNTGFIDQKKIC